LISNNTHGLSRNSSRRVSVILIKEEGNDQTLTVSAIIKNVSTVVFWTITPVSGTTANAILRIFSNSRIESFTFKLRRSENNTGT
jgi:hypothetical protein